MSFEFHNPYNFVRTPDRKEVPSDSFAGDHNPVGEEACEDHSRYWNERYSGVIPVRLRVQTPLFITNPDNVQENPDEHRIYDCLDYIPATALKGMLSSAYETITNSRYRVFSKKQHEKKLEFRTEAGVKKLYDAAPWDCLDDSLRPAESMERLSPADRLFGWVSQEGKGAWKGKVRISAGVYRPENETDRAVTTFDEPLPLSVLGTPKPAQARFYLGDAEGNPQKPEQDKEKAGYKARKKLRGRKVYLHHSISDTRANRERYWDARQSAEQPMPEYRYMAIADAEDHANQYRSITGWIEPRKDFFFDIRVKNLTREELGALFTLLKLDNCYFRLGYGKPLGLGSVALAIAPNPPRSLKIERGDEIASRYRNLEMPNQRAFSPVQIEEVVQAYKKAMAEAYLEEFQEPEPVKRSRWKDMEFTGLLDEIADYDRAWNEALERDEGQAPDLPSQSEETLLELFPNLIEELNDLYKEEARELAAERQQDYGWSGLSFIEELLKSMKGFKDAPVVYPRNTTSRIEEGFKWFKENEKTNRRVSLPRVGKTLNGYS